MHYKFLIYISYRYAIPIGVPLENEIIRREYSVKWFSDRDKDIVELNSKNNVLESIEQVLDYQPHIILAITDIIPDFINALKVQVFHGFPANKRKGTDQFKIRGLFDLYCTQGESSTGVFTQISKENKTFEAIETGWSKVDPLFPIVNKPISDNPVILIASTFTKQYSLALNDDVVNEIQRISKLKKWRFMIVLHPKLPESTKEKIKSIQNDYLTYYDTTDLIPLFKKADVMFSDTTSAIIEFLLQKKPVVTFKNNMPGPYLIDISRIEDIEVSIKKALKRPKQLIKEIEEFAQFSHTFNDGKSSKRVIDATISFLHKDKSHLKKKPLNLIRKYKIRKKLNYYTLKSFNRPFTIKDQD
ncbi:CDP-glycerol glycerophosphotransferase family protein [Winogradskyella immobilis]|uniref:CDP-glycerol glycerophosphotransferase family protein n=1 Tax=Winogradskyella immobilis TaxID=2816852 RepID=A0ABS8EQ65_9FLAO|nr:CDP-glycerol glycerophosphotransferase family protein [Winogradskyella immobilis]MCC1485250.1 CDP-glycerol glycerophosphotransferase family protein [Winogradskyella immobilis]MCG0017342.1 CDP-glycerol glycerophosphotransferase family protein [Winogradskyella immobilis]